METMSRTLIKLTIEEIDQRRKICTLYLNESYRIKYVEAWRRKSIMSQTEARKELFSLLDKKYPNWNILMVELITLSNQSPS